MNIDRCEVRGDSVLLVAGDDLNQVPRSHRALITPTVEDVFRDPRAYVTRLARRCRFGEMAKWLDRLAADGKWVLRLHKGPPDSPTKLVSIDWDADGFRPACVGLPDATAPKEYPRAIQHFYTMVSELDWAGGYGAGLFPIRSHLPIDFFSFRYSGDPIDRDETTIWGSSGCGDYLIFTADDQGGWICHEGDNYVHLIGTISDTIDWVFAELLADRDPNFDYSWPYPDDAESGST